MVTSSASSIPSVDTAYTNRQVPTLLAYYEGWESWGYEIHLSPAE
jgi:hypothetical protein